MRSGPALRGLQSHRAIHDAAYQEAKNITEVLEKVRSTGDARKAQEVAWILVEQWEARTLRHAEAEEQTGGLYFEALKLAPQLRDTVLRLERDHTLLRTLVDEIKALLINSSDVEEAAMLRFYALLPIMEFHSRQEETSLVEKIWAESEQRGTQQDEG